MLVGQSAFFEGLLTTRSLLQGCRYARQRIPSEETLLLPTVEHIDDIGDVAEMEWWWTAYSSSSGRIGVVKAVKNI